MTILIGFPNRHAENIRIYIKVMGEGGGFPTPLKTGASDPLRIVDQATPSPEAFATGSTKNSMGLFFVRFGILLVFNFRNIEFRILVTS